MSYILRHRRNLTAPSFNIHPSLIPTGGGYEYKLGVAMLFLTSELEGTMARAKKEDYELIEPDKIDSDENLHVEQSKTDRAVPPKKDSNHGCIKTRRSAAQSASIVSKKHS